MQRKGLIELEAFAEGADQAAAADLFVDVGADVFHARLRGVEQDRAQLDGEHDRDDRDDADQQQRVERCDSPAQAIEAANVREGRTSP